MTLRYHTVAARLPLAPISSIVGSDIPGINLGIRSVVDPYTGKKIYVVPPRNPDVTSIHVQRADRKGNVQIWGITGAQQEAVYAAEGSWNMTESSWDVHAAGGTVDEKGA